LANRLIGEFNKKMAKIKVTQVKSGIDRSERQKRTLLALGLRKMLATVEVEATPQILGMVEKVHHLVKVEEMA
jgi:large subunit ribosomal protein L30